jgi:hypothetical protein
MRVSADLECGSGILVKLLLFFPANIFTPSSTVLIERAVNEDTISYRYTTDAVGLSVAVLLIESLLNISLRLAIFIPPHITRDAF